MHNRVRMITASFLVKDLHVDWIRGARFFMEHLVDGDLSSNNHGWQWVAGTGTDAAPYFRIFNPTTQGEKFDPDGTYIRRWVARAGRTSTAATSTSRRGDPDGPPTGYPAADRRPRPSARRRCAATPPSGVDRSGTVGHVDVRRLDDERQGRLLAEVLELAEALPHRPRPMPRPRYRS